MRNFLPTTAEELKLSAFQTDRAGHRVGVYGYGVVGRAVVELLQRESVSSLRVIDGNTELEHPELENVQWCLGELCQSWLEDLDVLFIGPGVEPRHPLLIHARERGLLIVGELALLGNLPADLIAITGTNGKSTTTAWAGFILSDLKISSFVGGNLGDPITGWALRDYEAKLGVLELSSYQLETAYGFAPRVSVITNLAPDHASRYESNLEYYKAKSRIFYSQHETAVCILREDVSSELDSLPNCETWTFGDNVSAHGFIASEGNWCGEGIFDGITLPWHGLAIPGRHNAENALCAVLSVWAIRGRIDALEGLWEIAGRFAGLEHRLEFVSEHNQIRFYNDSKATNDESAATALEALKGPVVWLAGGVSKGAGYKASMRFLRDKVRHLIVFGAAAAEIRDEAIAHGFPASSITEALSLLDAVNCVTAVAHPGDEVLLSPACASFDEFKSFEERGAFFKEKVLELH